MIIWEPSLGSPCGCWRCRTPAGSATLSVSAVTVARSVSLNAASCVDASFLLRLLRRAPSSDEEDEDEDEDDDDEDEERRLLRRRFFSREFERPRRCRLSLSRPPASRPPPLRRSLLRDLDPRFLPSLPSFDRPRCLLRLEEGFLVAVVLIVAALAATAPAPSASPVFVVPPRVAHGDRGRPRAPAQWEIINRARETQNFGGADDVQGFASSSPFTHRRFATHASSRRGALFVKVHPPTRRRRSDRSTAEFRVRGVRSHTRAVGAANGGERCPVPRVATRRRWRRTT